MDLRAGASFTRLDKLKHVPQCAARKLSAVSFQHSAFGSVLSQTGSPRRGMKSSRRAKNLEDSNTVRCAQAHSGQLSEREQELILAFLRFSVFGSETVGRFALRIRSE
jgi:hypothetical protein